MFNRFIYGTHCDMKRSLSNSSRLSIAMAISIAAHSGCTPSNSSGQTGRNAIDRPPMELSAFDMSRVSAAGVSVGMDSSALISGQYGDTDTDVMTGIVTRGPRTIGYGFGSGEAFACCGDDADVLLDMTASGTGDYVFTDTHTVYGGNGVTKFGISQGIVLALSGPSHQELVAATRDYIDQLNLAPQTTYQPRTDLFASQAAK
ncbi:MAG: hypothetical protein ACR2RA_03205 [Geminicoccaceae bacterium]